LSKPDDFPLAQIVDLQLRGDWEDALTRLSEKTPPHFLTDVNRAICLFHLRRFDRAAALAMGLARIYPRDLEERDVRRLMLALLILAAVSHLENGNTAEACRAALEICNMNYTVRDLSRIPLGVTRATNGTLTIHEMDNAELIISVLVQLKGNLRIREDERYRLSALVNTYKRIDPGGKKAFDTFIDVLLREAVTSEPIDPEAIRRFLRGEDIHPEVKISIQRRNDIRSRQRVLTA
jgi:hypothetical protein